MARAMASPQPVTARDARRVLLHLQRLSHEPMRSSAAAVTALVSQLGYVQIDSINALERAHHLILATRLEGYRHAHLAHTLEQSRTLFEHWTHDACAIPTAWYPHWKHRFARYGVRVQSSAWWKSQFKGDPAPTIRRTLARVRREGPLRARDFEPPESHSSGGWWEWHPEKAALEHLWRSGKLAVVKRERFEKVYDLAERVLPASHHAPKSSGRAHLEWACREAIDRLGIATATELARFFHSVSPAEARAWCAKAVKRAELVPVVVADARSGRPAACVALPHFKELAVAPQPDRIVPLCPFDPVIRERARAERLFGFEYRFEAFTPAAKRIYGYYTLPLLEGDELIGRIDPKFDRANGTMTVRGPWWVDGVRESRQRTMRLAAALDRLASQIGAAKWTLTDRLPKHRA